MHLLERLPGSRYGIAVRAWQDGVVVCIATGPSLTAAQCEVVRRARERGDVAGAIVINDAYLLAPWADVLYFADAGKGDWLDWHRDRAEFRAFAGQKCMVDVDREFLRKEDDVFLMRPGGGEGITRDPGAVVTASNSGHQALNLAAHSGAATVLLLGYDAKRDGKKVHFFGDHPNRSFPPYNEIVKNMKTTVAPLREMGVRVVNCTPGSAIDCFERGTIEGLLPDPAAALVSA